MRLERISRFFSVFQRPAPRFSPARCTTASNPSSAAASICCRSGIQQGTWGLLAWRISGTTTSPATVLQARNSEPTSPDAPVSSIFIVRSSADRPTTPVRRSSTQFDAMPPLNDCRVHQRSDNHGGRAAFKCCVFKRFGSGVAWFVLGLTAVSSRLASVGLAPAGAQTGRYLSMTSSPPACSGRRFAAAGTRINTPGRYGSVQARRPSGQARRRPTTLAVTIVRLSSLPPGQARRRRHFRGAVRVDTQSIRLSDELVWS